MRKKWVVVLSDGATWEVVSPAMRVYEITDEEEADVDAFLRTYQSSKAK